MVNGSVEITREEIVKKSTKVVEGYINSSNKFISYAFALGQKEVPKDLKSWALYATLGNDGGSPIQRVYKHLKEDKFLDSTQQKKTVTPTVNPSLTEKVDEEELFPLKPAESNKSSADALKAKLDEKTGKRYADLSNKYDQLKNMYDHLNQTLSGVITTVDGLSKNYDSLRSGATDLENRLKTIDGALAGIPGTYVEAKQFGTVQKEIKATFTKAEDAKKTANLSATEINALKTELGKLQDVVGQIIDEII